MNRGNETSDSSRDELRNDGMAYANTRPMRDEISNEVPMGETMAYDSEDMTAPTVAEDMSVREIKITPLSSGYLVKVGCQSVAVETNETLVKYLTKYLDNPAEFEKKWYSASNRNRLENID
jgi:hypothetical protein